MMMGVLQNLRLEQIRIDGGTQPRTSLNQSTVSEYQESITEGAKLPPVTVFYDGATYWLADGFHRYFAHKKIGALDIQAEVHPGGQREAILHSVGANALHGLRRTNEDKRKAVMTLVEDAEWGKWSDREIARQCGVSNMLVGDVRKAHLKEFTDASAKDSQIEQTRTVERNGKTYEQNTANIGKKKDIAPAAPEPQKKPKRTLESELQRPAIDESDQLAEAHHTITELAAENEKLRDQLAVENIDASEEAKLEAQTIISELRERVRILELENEQLKLSRDTYMREAAEKQKQINYMRRQAERGAT